MPQRFDAVLFQHRAARAGVRPDRFHYGDFERRDTAVDHDSGWRCSAVRYGKKITPTITAARPDSPANAVIGVT